MAKVLERSLYQTDYYAWTKQQAAELRRLAAARVNTRSIWRTSPRRWRAWAGAILRPCEARCAGIIEHLLKLEHLAGGASRASAGGESVIEARDEIPDRDHGDAAPRGRGGTREALSSRAGARPRPRSSSTASARRRRALPASCPYSFDQIVGHDWYPDNRHGIVDDLADA